jgi:hypothetical protein
LGETRRALPWEAKSDAVNHDRFERLLVVFESADEVLHGLAAVIQAIKGSTADQIH